MKQKLFFSFLVAALSLVLSVPVFAQQATNTGVIASCPLQNPAGTVICPPGQYFINGTCRTILQSNFTACTTSDRNENFNCSTNGCVCEPGFSIDCRSNGITGFQKCLSAGTLPPVTCADANAEVVQCTGACGSCRSGFERINGTGSCVAVCPEGASRISDGSCLSLETVSNRVTTVDTRVMDLENLDLCHFNASGIYVNDDGLPCPETFDPASLSGQVATLRTGIEGLARLLSSIIPSTAITEIINNLISGDVTNLIEDITNILNQDPAPVRIATFVGFSPSVPNGNRLGYLNANDQCSSLGGAALNESHICTAQEIINTYVSDEAAVTGVSGQAWINNGPPGYIENVVNDCSGWRNDTATTFGSIWNFTNDSGSITPCNIALPFACCK